MLVIFGIGLALGIQVDIKFGELTLAFIFFNLMVTCIAEEGFFRLIIQEYLWEKLPTKYAGGIATLLSATIFTLAHFHVGEGAAERMFLIFLAGLLYAGVYWRSRQYISAVLTHFMLNLIHLSLLLTLLLFSSG